MYEQVSESRNSNNANGVWQSIAEAFNRPPDKVSPLGGGSGTSDTAPQSERNLQKDSPEVAALGLSAGVWQMMKATRADVDQGPAQRHLEPKGYATHLDKDGNLANVTDADGKVVRTFEDYKNGKPMKIGMEDGSSFVTDDGGKTWQRVTKDGVPAPFKVTNLTVDKFGNVSFDNELAGGRVTLCVDGTTIVAPDSRADYKERGRGAEVKTSADGKTMTVVDKDGKPIRTIEMDANKNPTLIKDSDGSKWEKVDGKWVHTRKDGSSYYYSDADFKVDSKGNVTYSVDHLGETVTETTDGYKIRVKNKK